MEPRDYEVRPLPAGAVRWNEIKNDVLFIYLPDDLDEITRQRYVTEALKERDWYHKRGIPLLLPASLAAAGRHTRHAVQQHAAATAITTVVALAGITGAATTILEDGAVDHLNRPPAAVPAPAHPTPSPPARHPDKAAPQPPGRPSSTPISVAAATDLLPATPPVSTAHPFRTAHLFRTARLIRHTIHTPRLLKVPHPHVVPRKPPPLPAAVPRPAACLLHLHLPPTADVRVGCNKR